MPELPNILISGDTIALPPLEVSSGFLLPRNNTHTSQWNVKSSSFSGRDMYREACILLHPPIHCATQHANLFASPNTRNRPHSLTLCLCLGGSSSLPYLPTHSKFYASFKIQLRYCFICEAFLDPPQVN